jgi:hypothetical protein
MEPHVFRRGRSAARILLAAGAVGLIGAAAALAADAAGPKDGRGYRRHLVVVRQAEIAGRVYYLSEGKEDDAPAAGVQVSVVATNSEESVLDTATDDAGRFTLTGLQLGTYQLNVGLLKVLLTVQDPPAVGQGQTLAPKAVLILIPRTLGTPAQEQYQPRLRGRERPAAPVADPMPPPLLPPPEPVPSSPPSPQPAPQPGG